MSSPVKPFLAFTWEEMEAKLTSEIRASFLCAQAVAPGMTRRGWGRIVNISSGLSRRPGDGFVAHCTAKSALDAFTRSLAHELGPTGVTVNTVAPGLTETDATAFLPDEGKQMVAGMTPLRRIGQPADVAGAVLYLASDLGRFTTGTYLPVDGGMTMLQMQRRRLGRRQVARGRTALSSDQVQLEGPVHQPQLACPMYLAAAAVDRNRRRPPRAALVICSWQVASIRPWAGP